MRKFPQTTDPETANPAELTRGRLLRGAGLAAAGTLAFGGTASAAGRVHPNVKLIQDYYAAYAAGDLQKLSTFFADDIRWTIPGHHPLSGTKTGITEVLAFFAELNRAGFQAQPIFLAADGDWVVDLHRGWSTQPAGLDLTWALAFRIAGRKIAEAVNFPGDQHAADAFFWRAYPLAPIPDRFA
ncbi:nuclear transport factor 2 family protein [Amycolatopsis sp. YIM 10]|uniref:nuclear transport factor 2 family protein n=1 Tax=Amycolatopsis sp. YIM 10 TaxID=2653857 RepID=UPI001D148593|nr:nuclear transport factor 2 family protein [Amycolatopsis sp. YIM 10]